MKIPHTSSTTAPASLSPQVLSREPVVTDPASAPAAVSPAATLAMLGVSFDAVTAEEAIERVDEMVIAGTPHYVVTPNVDFVVQASRDRELHRILLEADLVLTDGAPLVWLSRWLRRPFPERVAGSDLVPRLLGQAERKGYRVFFLGGKESTGQQAVEQIRQTYPGLLFVDHYSPPFAELLDMDQEAIRERVRRADPDLLFVCFGCPKQEKWIAMNYRAVGVPVTMGVGATIDFLAGQITRAPRWMRRCGLEWAYRLGNEPGRLFRRYLDDFRVFLPAATRQLWRLGRSRVMPKRAVDGAAGTVRAEPDRLRFSGVVCDEQIRAAQVIAGPLAGAGPLRLLDMSCVSQLSSAGLGGLIRWRKQVRQAGGELILLAPAAPVRDTLELMHLTDVFPVREAAAATGEIAPARFNAEGPSLSTDTGRGTACVLAWQGEVTAGEADPVWQRFVLDFERRPARVTHVEIDLSGVSFMDSTGIGLLLRAQKHAARATVRLSCRDPQPTVLNVLDLTNTRKRLLGS